ncbi:hypothetical protein E2C01_079061 [Portunus trituberculatus]|uniref:Uncharacterized protein n=1 Tax=Portunus trituberculatus TaxID=210409 RepID=A0A5B7IVU4_PORTR|nr:hypothetical protein [Portunus trituberculatus]
MEWAGVGHAGFGGSAGLRRVWVISGTPATWESKERRGGGGRAARNGCGRREQQEEEAGPRQAGAAETHHASDTVLDTFQASTRGNNTKRLVSSLIHVLTTLHERRSHLSISR